jgi:carbohydrate diacid regulator
LTVDTIQEIQNIIPLISKICPNQFYLVNSTGIVLASSESQEIGQQHTGFASAQSEDSIDSGTSRFRSCPLVVNGIATYYLGIIGTREEAEKFTPILVKYIEMVIKQSDNESIQNIKERAIRDFGRSLVKELNPEEVGLCQFNASLLEFDLQAPRMIMVADLSTYFRSSEVLLNTFEHTKMREQIYSIFRKVLDPKDIYFHLQDETYVILFEVKAEQVVSPKSLHGLLEKSFSCPISLGIGTVCTNLTKYNSSLYLANSALYFGKRMEPGARVYYYHDFIIPALLLSTSSKHKHIFVEHSTELLEYLQINQSIKETIMTFFTTGMNVIKTAEQMHYHRNTIFYRLNKFIEDTNINIFNAKYCAEVYMLVILLEYNI